MSENKGIIKVKAPIPFMAGFQWSVGFQMERFIKALQKKKLLASKCPSCGYVYVPARNRCGKCNSGIEEKDNIELSGKGTLVSFAPAFVELDGAGNWNDLEEMKIIGAVKLEGASSTVFMPLGEVEPENIEMGMPVEIKWNEKTEGTISDIKYFKPAK